MLTLYQLLACFKFRLEENIVSKTSLGSSLDLILIVVKKKSLEKYKNNFL
jgi:hypothetical protein